jgi:hypothetical protein
MKKEINYVSPKTAGELISRGIRWKASAYWLYNYVKGYVLKEKIEPFQKGYPAYTSSEIGHMIPFGFFNEMNILKLGNGYFQAKLKDEKWWTFISEAEARANYLIHLIDSGQVSVQGIENPEKKVKAPKNLPTPTV